MFDLRIVTKANVLSSLSRFAVKASAMSIDLKVKFSTFAKKTRIHLLSFCFLLLCFATPSAHAILLNDWIFNVDGTVSEYYFGDQIPTTGALSDGLGTLSLEITGAGAHNVIGFFDFEIDQSLNTFYNEFGATTGTPGSGQSWEIDEPGWVFGDIVDNVFNGALDNTNAVPSGYEEDVSYAMGWDFSLLDGDIATIDYIFTDTMPAVDFFLTQADPDDPNRDFAFYFYSELTIQTDGGPQGPLPDPGSTPAPVPEPGTAMLMFTGLLTAWTQRRRFIRSGK